MLHLGAETLPEVNNHYGSTKASVHIPACVTGSSGKSIYSQLIKAHETGWQGIIFFAHGDTPQAAAATHGYYVGS